MIRATVDTNILIYAVDADSGSKHQTASHIVGILSKHRSLIPLQCLSEFYRATTKKHLLTSEDAARVVRQFQALLQAVPYNLEDVEAGMTLHQTDRIQFFDALLIALLGG